MRKLKLFLFSLFFIPVLLFGQNVLPNPGFEEGVDSTGIPTGWIGYAQTGASMEVINDASTAHKGNYWVKCTSTQGGYYLLYQNSFPTKEGDVWKLSSYIKDISPAYPGGYFVALKISAKSVTGSTFKSWEIFQDSITGDWKKFSNTQTMPEGTAFIQAVLVIHAADGAPEAVYGIDDVKLELVPQADSTNFLANPGFEEGVDDKGIPTGWIGYAQTGASLSLVDDYTTSYSGDYWVKCTSTQGGYYLLYQNTFPSKEGDVWKFSSYIKDVSPAFPGGYYAALKISAKSVTGSTFKSWEIFQDSITTDWKNFTNMQTMPEGTASVQAVLVIHGADGAPEASYGIDNVKFELMPEVDTLNLLANPGFEEGLDDKGIPTGWIGYAQTGASMEVINDASTAHKGNYWVKCTSTQGGYYLLYQNAFPAAGGQTWKLSAFFKDVSPAFPGANFAALKISAKSVTGSTFQYWEIFPDSVTTEWAEYSNTQTLPDGTAYIQAVVVIHGADGAPEAAYGIDDVRLILENETSVEGKNDEIPQEFVLNQNYPNPFNPSTNISYTIAKEGNVSLKIFDVIGQEVASLVNEFQNVGNYTVSFNASQLSTGIYFYRIQSGSYTNVKKMMLIK